MMGRRAAENLFVEDDLRERGSQRRKEEREWHADVIEDMEGCQRGLSGVPAKNVAQ